MKLKKAIEKSQVPGGLAGSRTCCPLFLITVVSHPESV